MQQPTHSVRYAAVCAGALLFSTTCTYAMAPAVSEAATPTATTAPAKWAAPNQLDHWWILDRAHESIPRLPQSLQHKIMRQGRPFATCVATAITIHSDGSVTPGKVLRTGATASIPGVKKASIDAAANAIKHSRYTPAPANTARTPISTYVITTSTLTQSMPDKHFLNSIDAKCAVPDHSESRPASTQPEQS